MKPTTSTKAGSIRVCSLIALTIILATAAPGALFAKSTTWTHGSAVNDLWSNPDNWDNGAPVDLDEVYFSAIGGTSTNDISLLRLNELNMTGYSGTLSSMGSYQVAGTVTTSGVFDLGYESLLVGGNLVVNGLMSAPYGTIFIGGGLSISGELDCYPLGIVDVTGNITGSTGAILNMGAGDLSVQGNALLSDFSAVTWSPGGGLQCGGGLALQRITLGASGVTLYDVTVSRSAVGNVTQIESPGGLAIGGMLNVSTGTLKFIQGGTTSSHSLLGPAEGDVTVNGAVGIGLNGKLEMDYQAVAGIEFVSTLTVRGEFSYTKPGGAVRLSAGLPGKVSITSGGTFRITGIPPDRVDLQQDGIPGGGQWILAYDGTSTIAVDGVRVQDSDAQGPTPAPATNSADRGNNTNWDFIGPKTTRWTEESLMSNNWSDPLNWDLGSPQNGDEVLFDTLGGASTMDIPGLTLASITMSGYKGVLGVMHPLQLMGSMVTSGEVYLVGKALDIGCNLVVNGMMDASGADIIVGGGLSLYGELDGENATAEIAGAIEGFPGGLLHMESGILRVDGDVLLSDISEATWSPGGLLACAGSKPLQSVVFGATGVTLNDIQVECTQRTKLSTLGSSLTIGGALDVASGVLEIAGGNITVNGPVSIEPLARLEGASSAGNLEFQGTVIAPGDLSYTKAGGTVRFAAGTAGAIDITGGGTFEIIGTIADPVHVQQDGTTGGERWLLIYDETSTIAVDYVEMEDGDAQGGPIAAATNSLNVGNCANWYFGTVSASDTPPLWLSLQAAPNPFNPVTTVHYELPHAGAASIRIYDATGSLVRSLVSGHHEPGRYQTAWDGRNDAGRRVGSGAYFCRIESNGEAKVQKLLLLR
jgi:hypothetical protein